MIRFLKKNMKAYQVLLVWAACIVCAMSFSWGGRFSLAKDEEDAQSLSTIAEALTAYYNDSQTPKAEGVDGLYVHSQLEAGDAGAFLGFTSSHGFSFGFDTTSSVSYDYNSLADVRISGGGTTPSLLYYAEYGYVLGKLHLDTTKGAGAGFVRPLAGYLMLMAYVMSLGVDMVFSAVISILKNLNIFSAFYRGVRDSVGINMLAGVAPTDMPAISRIGNLVSILGKWYCTFYDLAWAIVIPFSLGLLLVTMLFKRQMQGFGGKVKRLIIRMAFIVIGFPLLGGIYSSCLDWMGTVSLGSGGMARVVASTFVDFESWAREGRLAIPTTGSSSGRTPTISARVDSTTSGSSSVIKGASPVALLNVRETAYLINRTYAYRIDSYSEGMSSYGPFATNLSGTTADSTTSFKKLDESTRGTYRGSDTAKLVSVTLDMLMRYAKGDTYTSGAYESVVQGSLKAAGADNVSVSKDIAAMYDKSSASNDFTQKSNASNNLRFDQMGFFNVNSTSNLNIFADGGLYVRTDDVSSGDNLYFYDALGTNGGRDDDFRGASTVSGLSRQQGLSAVAMYNYLNTEFADSKMTVYSVNKSVSSWTRKEHASVNLVGGGLYGFLYWTNAMALIVCTALIGYWYAFAIIFNNLKSSLSIIQHMPFGMLGSVKSIAKIVVTAVTMVLEIVVTILVYYVVVELLMNITQLVETPIVMFITGSRGHAGITENYATVGVILTTFIATICYIAFTIVAVKMRKASVKAFDQAANEILQKFITGSIDNPSMKGPGLGKQLMGAAAQGAGMAIGANMISGGGAGSGDPKDNVSTKEKDNEASGNGSGKNPPAKPAGGGGKDKNSGPSGNGSAGPLPDYSESGNGGDDSKDKDAEPSRDFPGPVAGSDGTEGQPEGDGATDADNPASSGEGGDDDTVLNVQDNSDVNTDVSTDSGDSGSSSGGNGIDDPGNDVNSYTKGSEMSDEDLAKSVMKDGLGGGGPSGTGLGMATPEQEEAVENVVEQAKQQQKVPVTAGGGGGSQRTGQGSSVKPGQGGGKAQHGSGGTKGSPRQEAPKKDGQGRPAHGQSNTSPVTNGKGSGKSNAANGSKGKPSAERVSRPGGNRAKPANGGVYYASSGPQDYADMEGFEKTFCDAAGRALGMDGEAFVAEAALAGASPVEYLQSEQGAQRMLDAGVASMNVDTREGAGPNGKGALNFADIVANSRSQQAAAQNGQPSVQGSAPQGSPYSGTQPAGSAAVSSSAGSTGQRPANGQARPVQGMDGAHGSRQQTVQAASQAVSQAVSQAAPQRGGQAVPKATQAQPLQGGGPAPVQQAQRPSGSGSGAVRVNVPGAAQPAQQGAQGHGGGQGMQMPSGSYMDGGYVQDNAVQPFADVQDSGYGGGAGTVAVSREDVLDEYASVPHRNIGGYSKYVSYTSDQEIPRHNVQQRGSAGGGKRGTRTVNVEREASIGGASNGAGRGQQRGSSSGNGSNSSYRQGRGNAGGGRSNDGDGQHGNGGEDIKVNVRTRYKKLNNNDGGGDAGSISNGGSSGSRGSRGSGNRQGAKPYQGNRGGSKNGSGKKGFKDRMPDKETFMKETAIFGAMAWAQRMSSQPRKELGSKGNDDDSFIW